MGGTETEASVGVFMKKQPIHQNLNTSFVNVGALVRYLRRLQFVGSIRIELASYEAEIVFTESNTIRAREYDHIAGRISHGADALNRILVRAKEPHGRIHVYKATAGYAGRGDGSIFVDKAIMSSARAMAASLGGAAAGSIASREIVLSTSDSRNALVLAALSELVRIIDDSLAGGNLSFSEAFRNECDGIAHDFPFIRQHPGALVYKKGEIVVSVETDTEVVSSAVFAALRPIFQRLRQHARYAEILRTASERLLELSTTRRTELVRLGLAKHIEDLLAQG
jgi:hypothetical protein